MSMRKWYKIKKFNPRELIAGGISKTNNTIYSIILSPSFSNCDFTYSILLPETLFRIFVEISSK